MGEPAPDWCLKFSIVQIAAEWECSDREIRADLADAERRGLLETRRVGKEIECRLQMEAWAKLPSAKRAGPRLVADEDVADADPETAEELAKKAASREEVKPFTVREGRPGPVRKLDVPASSLSISVQGGAAEVSGIRQGPHLTLTVKVASSKLNDLPLKSGSVVPDSAVSPPRTPARRAPAAPSHTGVGPSAARAGESIPSTEREALRDGLGLGGDVAMMRTLHELLRKGGGDTQGFVQFVDEKRRHRKKPILKGLLPNLAEEYIAGLKHVGQLDAADAEMRRRYGI